ncbi:hypothetical protein A6X21_06430 [Planctopirus hydrillae]|uniref:Uncharacterized protein n=1 Tax=Planctopirus hydrillae TaxID=1841610 RepID=A0A1C3E9R4_9PLAN|nr:hypothetical protein A6X21_06430 [Planctopirus hydrillae]
MHAAPAECTTFDVAIDKKLMKSQKIGALACTLQLPLKGACREQVGQSPACRKSLRAMLTALSEHARLAFEIDPQKTTEHACSEPQAWHKAAENIEKTLPAEIVPATPRHVSNQVGCMQRQRNAPHSTLLSTTSF